MSMYVEWAQATRGLEGEVCFLAGTVVASAEAGEGLAEALVDGPDWSGVRTHKYRTGT